ncbi:unnamed protein product [Symbiodinium natans]|uniref:Uncharacterized protein n=1 Tax=Symbiodinium natans TaxID=878477 RepID=A0A812T793_9DINO|nr:unnamed protein product [Symbiodinium natans]
MSQPAANVDSVILSWVIEGQATEYPCSVWQRDCFSSVFSDTAAESMALAQQISCLVAAKCTSKLQITDSDFAKEFKGAVRHKLSSLRTEFQEQQKFSGKSEVWRVGALEIVTSVVWAEEQLRQKNEEHSWVVRAAVRNGLLAYRPNPQTGRLEVVSEQPWAKADWSLSDSAKQISDLIRWDYFNPEEDLEQEPEEGGFDLDGELAEDLDLSLQNSLSLRLHPKLRRAAARRALEEGYADRVKEIRKKAAVRRERLKHRTAFRGKLLQSLRQKLMLNSRAEALAEVVPVRTETKGQKLSATTKPSAKNKPSAKGKASKFLKASAKKKAAKKHDQKATVDEVIGKVTAKKKKEKKEKKAQAKAETKAKAETTETESAALAPFLEKEVICVSEGIASDFQSGRYTVMTVSGTFEIRSEHLTLWEPKTAEFVWAQLKYLSRADTQTILRAISCWPEPKLRHDDYADHGLVPFPDTEKPFLVEDQWIWQGWAMMSWSLRKAKAGSFEEFSVECLDPGLPHLLFEFPEHLLEPRENAVKQAFGNALRLLVPVVRALHWTLLVAQRESLDQTEGFQWRLYDRGLSVATLRQPSAAN